MSESKHLLLSILDEQPKTLKYRVLTLKKIEEKYGVIPDKIIDENNNWKYELIADLYKMLLEQEGISIECSEIIDKLHVGNLAKVVNIIREALTPDLPEELLPATAQTGKKEKN